MEVYKTPSKETKDVLLASVIYSEVIEGLNRYFASEPRNNYISIWPTVNKQDFVLYEPEAWADILITWLRTKHGIFYYPGMEAKHAKSEKIKPFTERKMDEGALNSLKKLNKIVTGKEAGTNSHTLIADAIKYAVNAKESEINKLKDRITELESKFKAICDEDDIFRARALKAEEEIRNLKNSVFDMESMFKGVLIDTALEKKIIDSAAAEELRNLIFNDVVKVICQECYDRGLAMKSYNDAQKEAWKECYDYLWNALKKLSPDCDALKIDRYEDLVDRIFYEMSLIEGNCKECRRKQSTEKFSYIQRTNKAEEEVKKLKEQLDKAAADYQALSEENQKHKDSVFDLEKTCYRESYISDRIHEICAAKGVELDDTFLYNDDYTWEDLVGFLCEEIRKLKKEIENTTKTNCKDIMNYIRYEASQNGFELPKEIDGESLTIKRVFHDLLELMRKRGAEIRNLNAEIKAKESGIENLKEHITLLEADLKKRAMEIKEVNDQRWKDLRDINKALGYDGMNGHVDDFAKAVKARAECVKMALGEESDINALIRDYCTKNDIIAPSRYFSDKACVEYLFSIIDQKDRSFAILQDLYRDIFKKQPDGLLAEDIATKILDKVLETEDLLHKSVDSVNKECKATGKLMVEDYKLKLKDYILKGIKEHGYRYDGLETKSVEEIIDWIITMATCPRNEIKNLRGKITTLKDLINAMNEEVKDM